MYLVLVLKVIRGREQVHRAEVILDQAAAQQLELVPIIQSQEL